MGNEVVDSTATGDLVAGKSASKAAFASAAAFRCLEASMAACSLEEEMLRWLEAPGSSGLGKHTGSFTLLGALGMTLALSGVSHGSCLHRCAWSRALNILCHRGCLATWLHWGRLSLCNLHRSKLHRNISSTAPCPSPVADHHTHSSSLPFLNLHINS